MILFFFRGFFSLYVFTAKIFMLAYDCAWAVTHCEASRASFSYFTSLTYWGLGFYFLAAAIHTFTYARSGVPLLDRAPLSVRRLLQALHSLLYTTIVVYPFIVTIVYWGILYSGHWFDLEIDAWSNISEHMLNSVLALFEIVVPRTDPPPLIHMIWIVFILALYLALAYVTHATKGFYTYSFLDPAKGGIVAAYCFGIAVGGIIVFGVVWGLIRLRKWLTEEKLGRRGKFSSPPPQFEVQSAGGVHDLERGSEKK